MVLPFRVQAWFDDEKADQAKLPGEFEKSLNAFDRLILLRAMRPDRVSTALAKWIGEVSMKNECLGSYSGRSEERAISVFSASGVVGDPEGK